MSVEAKLPQYDFSHFEIHHYDGEARTGVLHTAHGDVQTPAFMPCGTQAAVKACTPEEVAASGASMLLCNAYHLMLRPGVELIERCGGLQKFMGWNGPILTDSGGYQLVSLGSIVEIKDDVPIFISPYDGARVRVTPEDVIQVQTRLGSDVIMCLDHPVPFGTDAQSALEATARTHRWATRSRAAHPENGQLVFGIVQGGFDVDARHESSAVLADLDFDGIAIGGLVLGEPVETMVTLAQASLVAVSEKTPRYLMGLGTDLEILALIDAGIDMFDCVLPTRLARTGVALTANGRLSIRHARYREDLSPLETDCPCAACSNFSRAYLRHLFVAGEILAHRLISIHNLTHLGELMSGARVAIATEKFSEYRSERTRRLSEGIPLPLKPVSAGDDPELRYTLPS